MSTATRGKKRSASNSETLSSSPKKITPLTVPDIRTSDVITPETPGAAAVRDIINEHCYFRGRIDGLFSLANFLMDEFLEKLCKEPGEKPRVEKLFKSVVLLGRDGLSTLHPFPSAFFGNLENAMFKELGEALKEAGVAEPAVAAVERIKLNVSKEERSSGRTVSDELTCIYYNRERLPKEYRGVVERAATELGSMTNWAFDGGAANSVVSEHDLTILRDYADAMSELMRDATACIEEAKLSSFEVRDEFSRYERLVHEAINMHL